LAGARWRGYGLAALSAVGYATLGVFAAMGYRQGLSTADMVTWRFFLAAVILAVASWMQKQAWPRGPDLWWLIAAGGVGYPAMSWMFLAANRWVPAGVASAVVNTAPAWVVLGLALRGVERLTGPRLAALAGTLGGGLLLAGLADGLPASVGPTAHWVWGVALAFGSAVVYTVYVVAGADRFRRIEPLPATAVLCTAAFLSGLCVGTATGSLTMVTQGFPILLGLALFSTVVASGAFLAAARIIGPGQAALLGSLEPPMAALMGAAWLGQALTLADWVAIALVMAGTAVLRWETTPASTPALDVETSDIARRS
jgi:drug/metabolite transporter (DMT)-like permease